MTDKTLTRLQEIDRKMHLTQAEAEEVVERMRLEHIATPNATAKEIAKRLGLKEHTVIGYRNIARDQLRREAGGGTAPWKGEKAAKTPATAPEPGVPARAVPKKAGKAPVAADVASAPGRPKPGTKAFTSWAAFDALEVQMGKIPTSKELAASARAIGNVTSDRSSAAAWLKWRNGK